jgi:RimJ/RimL family protein N-acetyltransferase
VLDQSQHGLLFCFLDVILRKMKLHQTTQLQTERLLLRCWQDADRIPFAKMNQHPEVMSDLGGAISLNDSNQKMDRYAAAFEQYGFSRWVIERDGEFLGYCGVMRRRSDHPLGSHDEIGWRLVRHAWLNGFATEAAKAALDDVFHRVGLTKVYSYTAVDNLRSQAVMERIGLQRKPALDFSHQYTTDESWHGLVWEST